jgi:hypothetical protein
VTRRWTDVTTPRVSEAQCSVTNSTFDHFDGREVL